MTGYGIVRQISAMQRTRPTTVGLRVSGIARNTRMVVSVISAWSKWCNSFDDTSVRRFEATTVLASRATVPGRVGRGPNSSTWPLRIGIALTLPSGLIRGYDDSYL